MRIVGRVLELWRFPVKSLGGERITRSTLGPLGVPGDRGWALRDETAGEIRGAKKLPALLGCSARYRAEPDGDAIPAADIVLPDGSHTATDDPAVATHLSAVAGRPLTLWPRRPATDDAHYRRAAPDNPDFDAEMRAMFGRTPDEPLPDFTGLPPEIFEFTSPRGTYFDVFPLHLVTTASLAAVGRDGDAERRDVRRFRPNVVIDSAAASGFVETDWSGRRLRIGGATLTIEVPTVRCVMVTLAQPNLAKDTTVLRSIVRDGGQNLGVYATVAVAGPVAVGDAVELL